MASRSARGSSSVILSSSNPGSSPRPSPSPGTGTSGARRRSALKGTSLKKSPPSESQASNTNPLDDMDAENFRGEFISRDAEIERLKIQLREREISVAESLQEAQALKHDLEDARSEQHRLDDEIAILQHEVERLKDQARENEKCLLDSQMIAENERLLEENKTIVRSNSELSAQVRSLRRSLQSGKSREASQSPEELASLEPFDDQTLKISLREKERQIGSLKLELADMEVRLAEQTNSAASKARDIEDALLQLKLENIRLTENIESYQMLLQDRTLRGEYSITNLEGVPERDEANSSRSTSPIFDESRSQTNSLAAEIQAAETPAESVTLKALRSENRQLRDSSKAMALYINEIIQKLLQTKGFEQVFEKDVNKSLPTTPHDRRSMQPPSRMSFESYSRRNVTVENPTHKRMTTETGIGGGITRAFSFRRKPDTSIANLRPLKLVEEQQPQATLRSDGTMSHVRSRTQTEEGEESTDAKAAKRVSWVPGWFAKAGTIHSEGD